MMQKYSQETLLTEKNGLQPKDSTLQFLLNYSKSIEVKKLRKSKILICKN